MNETTLNIVVILPNIGKVSLKEALEKGLLEPPHNKNYGKSNSLLGRTYEEIHGVAGAKEKKEQMSKTTLAFYEDHPEYRENLRKIVTKRFEDPKERERTGQTTKKWWNSLTPEEKENQLRNGLYNGSQSPNLSESELIPMLEPLGFQYNGRGPVIINGKRPDYIHEIFPTLLIEYDGDGGHNPNVPWVPKNQPQLDDQRDIGYRKVGCDALRLLPEDKWEGKEHVQNKVKEWMEMMELI